MPRGAALWQLPLIMANGTQVEPLVAPEFKSVVPEPLLELCKDTDEGHIRRYLLESNSRQEEATKWLCVQTVKENKSLRDIEARLNEAESEIKAVVEWKNTLTGKSAVAGAAIFILLSAIVGAACKSFVDHLTK